MPFLSLLNHFAITRALVLLLYTPERAQVRSGGWGTIVEQRGARATMQARRGSRKSLPAGARYCVTIFLDPLVEVSRQMRDFPLRPGEMWVPCTDRALQVYLCMGQPLMTPQQAAWLLERDVAWEYL